MVKKKEILEKIWPGENNEKREDYKTKCALSGEPIDLDVRQGEPGYGNLDHELARAKGGSNDADNCQPLHGKVNGMKGDMTNEELFKWIYKIKARKLYKEWEEKYEEKETRSS